MKSINGIASEAKQSLTLGLLRPFLWKGRLIESDLALTLTRQGFVRPSVVLAMTVPLGILKSPIV